MSEKIEQVKHLLTTFSILLSVGLAFLAAVHMGVSAWLAALAALSIVPAYGFWRLQQASALRTWERVPAIVESVQVKSRPVPGEHLSFREYYPVVCVRHMVGQEYIQSECYSNMAYDYASYNQHEVEPLVAAYSVGQELIVLRNPTNPAQVSIVDRVSPKRQEHYIAITAGGLIAVFTLVALWAAIAL